MWDIIRVSAGMVAFGALAVSVCVGYARFVDWASIFLIRTGWI